MLKDHNAVTPVRLEPAASRSRVKHNNELTIVKLIMIIKIIIIIVILKIKIKK